MGAGSSARKADPIPLINTVEGSVGSDQTAATWAKDEPRGVITSRPSLDVSVGANEAKPNTSSGSTYSSDMPPHGGSSWREDDSPRTAHPHFPLSRIDSVGTTATDTTFATSTIAGGRDDVSVGSSHPRSVSSLSALRGNEYETHKVGGAAEAAGAAQPLSSDVGSRLAEDASPGRNANPHADGQLVAKTFTAIMEDHDTTHTTRSVADAISTGSPNLDEQLRVMNRASLAAAVEEESEEQRFAADFMGREDPNMEGTAALCKDFVAYKTLGEGGQGQVVLVRHVPSKQLLALKKQSKRGLLSMVQDGTFASVKAERNAMLDNDSCEFITSLYLSFQTPDDVYMVMEFAPGGSLHNYIQGYAPDDPPGKEQTTLYLAEMVSAIRHMHMNGYVNRDIKPDNILIDWDGHLKLCDLGLATKAAPGLALLGTEFFYPPKGEAVSFHTDYWALGLTFVELITSSHPIFEEAQKRFPNFKTVYDLHVFESSGKLRSPGMSASERATGEIKRLVRHLLFEDPSRRLGYDAPEAHSILNHKGFSDVDWDRVVNKGYSTESFSYPRIFSKGRKKPGRSILVAKDKNKSFMGKMLSSLKKTMTEEELSLFRDWEYASPRINETAGWQLDDLRSFCVSTVSRITHTSLTDDGSSWESPN